MNELTIEDSGALRVMMRKKYEDFLVILNHIEKDITPHQVTGGNTVIIPKARFNLHIAISCKRRDFPFTCISISNIKTCNFLHSGAKSEHHAVTCSLQCACANLTMFREVAKRLKIFLKQKKFNLVN